MYRFISDYVQLTTTPLGPEFDELVQEFVGAYKGDFNDTIDYNDFFAQLSHDPAEFIIR